jgi:uncharacterized protein
MEKLTFLGLANKVLTEEKRPLSPSEVWKVALSKGYHLLLDTQGKTPERSLYSSIFTDARDNPNTNFIKVGDRPARYYLKSLGHTSLSELEKKAASEPEPTTYHYKESQLHPFLSYFVHRRFNAYSKTIRHGTSGKKEFGEWVHPDVIAIYYPVPDWRDGVIELSKAVGSVGVKLYFV